MVVDHFNILSLAIKEMFLCYGESIIRHHPFHVMVILRDNLLNRQLRTADHRADVFTDILGPVQCDWSGPGKIKNEPEIIDQDVFLVW